MVSVVFSVASIELNNGKSIFYSPPGLVDGGVRCKRRTDSSNPMATYNKVSLKFVELSDPALDEFAATKPGGL